MQQHWLGVYFELVITSRLDVMEVKRYSLRVSEMPTTLSNWREASFPITNRAVLAVRQRFILALCTEY